MKKILFVILMLLLVFIVPAFAEEVASKPAFMEEYQAIIGQIALMLISIIGPVICYMLFLIFAKISKKLGFELDEKEEAYIKDKLVIGKGAAEQWARNMKQKPTGHEKLLKALEVADQAMDKTKVKNYAQNKLVNMVESMLDEEKKINR